MQTILVNVTWRGFKGSQDVAIMDMTHSNIFKQQGMFHTCLILIYFKYVTVTQKNAIIWLTIL